MYKCVPVPVCVHRHDVQGLLLVFLHSIKPALVHNLLCKLVRLEQLVELHGGGSLKVPQPLLLLIQHWFDIGRDT